LFMIVLFVSRRARLSVVRAVDGRSVEQSVLAEPGFDVVAVLADLFALVGRLDPEHVAVDQFADHLGQHLSRRGAGMIASVLGDGSAERLKGDRLGFGAAALTGVEGVDGGELVGGQVEVEHVEVLRDPGRFG
jgi:hypothetical protein